MKLKKILAAAAASIMLCTMTACGEKNTSSTTSDAASSAAGNNENSAAGGENSSESANPGADIGDKVYNVGICQLLEHPALDEATRGFKDKLTELLGEDHIKFDTQYAQGEITNCTTIVNNFVSANVDLMLANATAPMTAAASATNSIPIVGTSITDYPTALGIKDGWTGKSGKNITGTSDLAPIDQQEALLKEMFPNAKKVGILYCSAEANSKYQADLFEAALKADGIEYKEFTAADSNEIPAVTQAAIGECDVLYIPTDNTFADATETVKNIVEPAKIPVIAGEEGICGGCGVATLSISYYDIGSIAGEMAYDILVNGTNPGDMEIKSAPKFTKKYNAKMCESLGITPPEGYEAIE